LFKSWYESGQKREKINYQNGKLHGLYETWDEKGLLIKRKEYQNDTMVNLDN